MGLLDFPSYDKAFLKKLEALKSEKNIPKREDELTSLKLRINQVNESGAGVSGIDFERILGRNDLMRINYLERGLIAARAVCRVIVPDIIGNASFGTGFLITPRLIITNHHVISSIAEASGAIVEFNYESDANGLPKPTKRFRLRPDLTFLTSHTTELDFTIVAIAELSEDRTTPTTDYSFLRLIPKLHKIEEAEYVTIIQHPNGEEKQIAIRENKVLKIGDKDEVQKNNFIWYTSDTAPGASGSPVFNDQWQVVGVHHRSEPETVIENGKEFYKTTDGKKIPKDDARAVEANRDILSFLFNEGIRASKIIENVQLQLKENQTLQTERILEFLDDVLGIKPIEGFMRNSSMGFNESIEIQLEGRKPKKRTKTSSQDVRPIAYYKTRTGYDPNFLGVPVPLPELTSEALQYGEIARLLNSQEIELKYQHFSVVFNATRKLAFYTAVNIDGKKWMGLERGKDRWYYDPRLPLDIQLGNDFYSNEAGGNYFDRGHLVRRQDPTWGSSDLAQAANIDTFHWVNCSPQYFGFNQSAELWQGLENYLLYNTDQEDIKATVFNGPIFQHDDEIHRGIPIPQYFWKVIMLVDDEGKYYSSAYVVSQEKWAKNIPFEELPVGNFNNFQVPIKTLADRTGLKFASIVLESDVLREQTSNVPLRCLADVQHPRRKGRKK